MTVNITMVPAKKVFRVDKAMFFNASLPSDGRS